jgi:ABC-type multidrug transport system fused ATPase/permease subunit
MGKMRLKLIRWAIALSVVAINLLVIILMILWNNYIERYKDNSSSAVLTMLKTIIINSDTNDIDATCSSMIEYIDNIPHRKIAIYDEQYNLHRACPEQFEDFSIKDNSDLFKLLNSLESGKYQFTIDDHSEDIFWSWITTNDGSKRLLIVFSMEFDAINEFSFVFIISYLLIVFVLILAITVYINYRQDYFSSLIRLYRLTTSCDS